MGFFKNVFNKLKPQERHTEVPQKKSEVPPPHPQRTEVLRLIQERGKADADERAEHARAIKLPPGYTTNRVSEIKKQAEAFDPKKFFSEPGVQVESFAQVPKSTPTSERVVPILSVVPEKVVVVNEVPDDSEESVEAGEVAPEMSVADVRAELNAVTAQKTEAVVAINTETRALALQVRGSEEYRAVRERLNHARTQSFELLQKERSLKAKLDELTTLKVVENPQQSPELSPLQQKEALFAAAVEDLNVLKAQNPKSPATFDKRKQVAALSDEIASLKKAA